MAGIGKAPVGVNLRLPARLFDEIGDAADPPKPVAAVCDLASVAVTPLVAVASAARAAACDVRAVA